LKKIRQLSVLANELDITMAAFIHCVVLKKSNVKYVILGASRFLSQLEKIT